MTEGSSKPDLKAGWRSCRPYAVALVIFIASRLLVSLAIAYAARFIPQDSASGLWNVDSPWLRYLLRFDSGWYISISEGGYSYNGTDLIAQSVVFYPLYPLASRLIANLFGLENYVALLMVSNAAILTAIPLTFKLIRDDYGDQIALYAIALLSFFPASFFFSTGYTESLTLLLIICFFLLLRKERYILAAACVGLTLATRSTGIALLLPLLWALWQRFKAERKQLVGYIIVCIVLATSGLWLYMIYLWQTFNSPLAFVTGHRAWLEASRFGNYSYPVYLLLPFRLLGTAFTEGLNPLTLEPWFFFLFSSLILVFRKRISTNYFLFALGVLLLPYLSFGGILLMRSFARYIMLAFPVFIIMADLLKIRLWLVLSVVTLFAAVLFMYTALFAQWYWVG